MRKMLLWVFLVITLGAVPRVLNYQGKLLDSSGVGINDTIPITFRLYTSATGGSAIWEETIPNVAVRNGLFSVELGNLNSFPDSVDFSTQYWLEVTVAGETMSPRERLNSAPYSIRSAFSERGYNPVSSDANRTRRTGDFVFRAGTGATLTDDGSTINIVLGTTTPPSLAEVLATGNTALGERIRNLGTPIEAQDAATKAYVDARTESPDWLTLINRERGAGKGLSFEGDSFSVNIDNSTLEIVSDRIRVKPGGITSTEIATSAVSSDELAPTGVVAGTYTTANITVDEDGRITYAENGMSGVQGSGSQNMLAKWVGDSIVGNSIIYDNGTKVGIGTTSPETELDIVGNLKITGNFFAPNRPAFSVYNTNHITAPGIVKWDGIIINVGGYYSPATGQFTAPVTGLYFFAYGGIKSYGNSSYVSRLRLRINGSCIGNNCDRWQARISEGAVYGYASASVIIPMTTGQKAEVYMDDSGGLHANYGWWIGFLLQ